MFKAWYYIFSTATPQRGPLAIVSKQVSSFFQKLFSYLAKQKIIIIFFHQYHFFLRQQFRRFFNFAGQKSRIDDLTGCFDLCCLQPFPNGISNPDGKTIR